MWSWNWLDRNIIGDADGRVHLYNSTQAPVSLVVRNEADETLSSKPITINPRTGYTHSVINSGTHTIDIQSPEQRNRKKLTAVIPPRAEGSRDVLFNIGRSGALYLVPLFYLPTDWDKEKQERELKRLDAKHKERKYVGKRKVGLPVKIDYGFDQGAPLTKYDGVPPTRHSWLIRLLKGSEEKQRYVYYLLADESRYGEMERTLASTY